LTAEVMQTEEIVSSWEQQYIRGIAIGLIVVLVFVLLTGYLAPIWRKWRRGGKYERK